MADAQQLIDLTRNLLEGRFDTVLSTASAKYEGHPFGSLVPFCLDSQKRPLLLLSHLSEHTHNLEAEPRCSYTITQDADRADIQQLARLTGMAQCERITDADEVAAAARRYFRYFPASRPYFEQLNFIFYRMPTLRFYLVGGFGAARWFGTDRIIRPASIDEAQEVELIEALNKDQALLHNATRAVAAAHGEIRVVGSDGHGLDLMLGGRLMRLPLGTIFSSVHEARELLIRTSKSEAR